MKAVFAAVGVCLFTVVNLAAQNCAFSTNAANITSSCGWVGILNPNPFFQVEIGNASAGETDAIVTNTDPGTGSFASVGARNGTGMFNFFRMMAMGSGYNTYGGYIPNSGVLQASANLVNGISILAAGTTAPIRFYTGGATSQRAVLDSSGNLGIGSFASGSTFATTGVASLLHLSSSTGAETITFDTPTGSTPMKKLRFGTIPGIPSWGALSLNAKYNSTTGVWDEDDPNFNAWFFKLDDRATTANPGPVFNGLWLYRVPAGGAAGSEYPVFGVTTAVSAPNDATMLTSGNLGVGYSLAGLATALPPMTAMFDVNGTGHFAGKVAIGTTSSNAFLQLAPTSASVGFEQMQFGSFNVDSSANVGGRLVITELGTVGINIPNPSVAYKLDVNGAVHLATTLEVGSDIHSSGTIWGTNVKAQYQDVAEWVPSGQRLVAGTVVTINSGKKNEVLPSSRAYDTSVAGVVSEQPGLILGVEGDAKSQIATTGRVRVHVDATSHPIVAGDLLVTSGKPGTAMYSDPVDLGGIKIHRPGTIIGKALEPLQSGEGEILVLLSLQ